MACYYKPGLNLEGQVQELSDRGLVVNDISRAEEQVRRIGYYRLSSYLHPFRQRDASAGDSGGLLNSYKPGTTLDQVLALVDYDRRLRLLMLDAVEQIETSVGARLGYALGKRSPFAHFQSFLFDESFISSYKYGAWLAKAGEAQERSHELFVQHFDDAHGGYLPIWALTELLDLGQLAVLYSGLKREIATEVAQGYSVPTKALFRSWLASINDVRNLSTHHARLFNRKLVHAPKRPKAGAIAKLEHLREPGSSKGGFGLYNVIAIMAYLLDEVDPGTTWPQQLTALVDQFPTNEHIDIDSMGFPQDWKELDLWSASA
ncbi:Abi family protein [Corynebacterium sp.]|uniref:Abi family protein n=1 Tax=Corynebacterium sp. TaxID=1720 RepID=UPI0026DD5315|nr:Abi family protein [Corynebacterium sp.]MDO4914735.1 Abi family protein [Corynebacterium sp.]